MSGFAHINGMADGPPILPGFALADGVAAMCGAYAIMFAIFHRDVRRTGQGQYIDLALYEPLATILGVQSIEFDALGVVQCRKGSQWPSTAPRNTYRTKDGRWVALSASSPAIAERVFRLIGRSDLIEDPRFKTNKGRLEHVDEIDRIISNWIGEHDYETVIRRFEEYQAAIGPVYDISHLLNDPQAKERRTFIRLDDSEIGAVRMINAIPKFSRTPGRIQFAGPRLGEHNEEVYVNKLGYEKSDLKRLKSEGVI
jgi:formyl-CoA transferase